MSSKAPTVSLTRIKREAKQLSRSEGIKLSKAQEIISKQYGYQSFSEATSKDRGAEVQVRSFSRKRFWEWVELKRRYKEGIGTGGYSASDMMNSLKPRQFFDLRYHLIDLSNALYTPVFLRLSMEAVQRTDRNEFIEPSLVSLDVLLRYFAEQIILKGEKHYTEVLGSIGNGEMTPARMNELAEEFGAMFNAVEPLTDVYDEERKHIAIIREMLPLSRTPKNVYAMLEAEKRHEFGSPGFYELEAYYLVMFRQRMTRYLVDRGVRAPELRYFVSHPCRLVKESGYLFSIHREEVDAVRYVAFGCQRGTVSASFYINGKYVFEIDSEDGMSSDVIVDLVDIEDMASSEAGYVKVGVDIEPGKIFRSDGYTLVFRGGLLVGVEVEYKEGEE